MRPMKQARISNAVVKEYERAHWGIPPSKVFEVHDPDLPAHVPAMGRLLELRCKSGSRRFDLDFRGSHCILGYAPTKDRRLFLILSLRAKALAKKLWKRDEATYALPEVAKHVGGRQARYAHHDQIVQCLGEVTHVLYATEKAGDDAELLDDGRVEGPGSEYIHKFSEDSHGPLPMLCLSRDGRLWLAAGCYSVQTDGIVD